MKPDMTNEPLSGDQSEEIRVFIHVSKVESESLLSFFNSTKGIKARPNWGVYNSIAITPEMVAAASAAGRTAPYLVVSGAITILAAAINSAAKMLRSKLVITKNSKGGIKIEATNISPKELKDIGIVDLIKFEPLNEESDQPETPPYTESNMGFKKPEN